VRRQTRDETATDPHDPPLVCGPILRPSQLVDELGRFGRFGQHRNQIAIQVRRRLHLQRSEACRMAASMSAAELAWWSSR
jgi:hypothetical protein